MLNNLINLASKYFYKTEEKPAKYHEWLTSIYENGKWYICEFLYYDNGSSDNSTNYSFYTNNMNATLTYNSNQYYVITAQQYSSNGSMLKIGEIDVQNCEISIDFYWASGEVGNGGYNATMKLSGSNYTYENSTYIGTWSNNKVIGTVVDGTDYRQKPTNRLSMNTWYTFKATINDDTILSEIILKNNNSIVASATTPMMNIEKIGIFIEIDYVASTNYFTNFKVRKI